MADLISSAMNLLLGAQRIAVFSGAGLSADSGLATFRDADNGRWNQVDVAKVATRFAFKTNRDAVWTHYEHRRREALRAEPNAGHLALTRLQAAGRLLGYITQNVDDLHERAGHAPVHHLHGSLFAPRCVRCNAAHAEPLPLLGQIPDVVHAPPSCRHCRRGVIRPGVVWFGESLPRDAWAAAKELMARCDAVLILGTSGQVKPAADLPHIARRAGKPIVVIDPAPPTTWDDANTVSIVGHASEVLPMLVDQILLGKD